MSIEKKLAVIGVGNMGSALTRAWLQAGLIEPASICLADADTERLRALAAELGVQTADNRQAVAADIVILAVKPQIIPEVLTDIRNRIGASHLIISIAAGLPLSYLEEMLPRARLLRVMPNTPLLIRAGVAAIAQGTRATAQDLDLAQKLFDSVGRSVIVEEKFMDAVTGLSGSGPAYVFLFLEALADGGVKMGLPRQTALLLAAQTILGSAALFLESGHHPGILKDQVASPGGTTITGLHVLEAGGFRGLIMSAVEAATSRSQELATVRPTRP